MTTAALRAASQVDAGDTGDFTIFSTDLYHYLRAQTPEFEQLAAMQAGHGQWAVRRGNGLPKSLHGGVRFRQLLLHLRYRPMVRSRLLPIPTTRRPPRRPLFSVIRPGRANLPPIPSSLVPPSTFRRTHSRSSASPRQASLAIASPTRLPISGCRSTPSRICADR